MKKLHRLSVSPFYLAKVRKGYTKKYSGFMAIIIIISILLPYPVYAQTIDIQSQPELQPIIEMLNQSLIKELGHIGNEGEAHIESLTFNSETLEIQGVVVVIARHSWVKILVPTFQDPGRRVEVKAEKKLTGSFVFNVETQRLSGNLDFGEIGLKGSFWGVDYNYRIARIKIDLERFQRAIAGDFIAMIELIPMPNLIEIVHQNEYKRIRQSKWDKYGRDNVYFASKEFVNWASSARVATWIGTGILTAGASVSLALAEVQSESMKELSAITIWLEAKGIENAESVAKKILTGEKVDWPFIKVEWQSIKYEVRYKIAGKPVSPWISDRHAAFYLVWQGEPSSNLDDSDSIATRNIFDFDGNGKTDVFTIGTGEDEGRWHVAYDGTNNFTEINAAAGITIDSLVIENQ